MTQTLPPDPLSSRACPRQRRHARLMRQFHTLRRMLPWLDGWLHHLQSDRAALVGAPAAGVARMRAGKAPRTRLPPAHPAGFGGPCRGALGRR